MTDVRRPDLLALSADDLATLANRGLVKRAQKDLESGNGPASLDVDESGNIRAVWPDGAAVALDSGAVLSDRCCTCAAFTICRHIVGTVLAYQASFATVECENEEGEDGGAAGPGPATPQPWDPGTFSDAILESFWKPAQFASIRNLWSAGVVAEVHRSAKPLARLHSSGVTLRFLVPDDVRYVQCDCAEDSPCKHVPLAVWSFRQLAPDRKSGLIAANQPVLKAPIEISEECEGLIASLFTHGVADLPPNDVRTWEGLATRLRRAGLIWPEQVALEWLALRQQYLDRDARFDSSGLVERSAEMLIRLRAICSNTGSVPQLFLRGARDDASELGTARLMGLGTMISVQRKSVQVTAMLQDLASGAILSMRRETAGHGKEFHSLAQAFFAKQITFAAAGSGQLLVKGAKRSINGEVTLTRAAAALSPQAYEWEKLRAPVLVEGIDELRGHLDTLPPAALRPRHAGQTFHVVPVGSVTRFFVDPMSRRLLAFLADPQGEPFLLEFPFYTHGRTGFARLFESLERRAKVRFVAGSVRNDPAGLIITPAAVVTEDSPSVRSMIQPWVDQSAAKLPALDALTTDATGELEAFARFRLETISALGEAALTGLANAGPLLERRWSALIEQGREIGLERFLAPAIELHASVESRKGSLAWNSSPAVEAAVRQAVLAVFA